MKKEMSARGRYPDGESSPPAAEYNPDIKLALGSRTTESIRRDDQYQMLAVSGRWEGK